MNIVSLNIEAISGAVGGNVAGAAMKENSLGTMGNSMPELSVVAWAERSSKPLWELPLPAVVRWI